MYFLGQAAHFSRHDRLRHTFAVGTTRDSREFRQALARHYGSDFSHTALYHSGRSALSVALRVLLPKGSKIGINGFTCQAVVQAVKSAGQVPIYLDIAPGTLHFGATELRNTLKAHPDLKAIVIQNTLGYPADLPALEKIAKKYQLEIIEDLAHSVGVIYPDGREAGTVGQAVALSFGKGKSIDTSCGGALILRDTNLREVKQPCRLPSFLERVQDRLYPAFGALMRCSRRFRLHKFVTGGLLALKLIARSADAKLDINTRLTHWQAKLAFSQWAYRVHQSQPLRHYFFVKDREEVLRRLATQHFFFSETWYDVPISPARYYARANFPEKECPNATRAAAEIINFPIYYPDADLKPAYQIINSYLKEPNAKK